MHDERDLTLIYNETYPGLCRFVESLVGRGTGLAQEIAQEAFLRLCQKKLENVPSTQIRFWLFHVARNLALNEAMRGRTRLKSSHQMTEMFSVKRRSPEEEIEQSENRNMLFELITLLPEQQRSALMLREQEEMSYREIAFVLNASESKVKVDIFRARMALRENWITRQTALKGK